MNCTYIPINDDRVVEPTEPFTISFSMFGGLPPNASQPPPTVTMVTIIDDGTLRICIMTGVPQFRIFVLSLRICCA